MCQCQPIASEQVIMGFPPTFESESIDYPLLIEAVVFIIHPINNDGAQSNLWEKRQNYINYCM